MSKLLPALFPLFLVGCAHVCPRNWEVSTGVSHSALWGDSVEASTSVGGSIGPECRTPDED